MKCFKILLILGWMCLVGTNLTEDAAYLDEEYDDVLEANSTHESPQLIASLSNATRFESENLTLICELKTTESNITNGKINLQWFHMDSAISPNKKIKLVTKKDSNKISSQIRIKSLKLTDAGLYSCVFTKNNLEIAKSECYINIIPKIESTSQTPTTPKKVQKNTILNSRIPRSTITSLSQVTEGHITAPSVTTDVNLSKKFTLKIENQEVEEKPSVYNASQPFCQRYVGKTCQLYLGNQYVFIQPPYTQENIEDNINEAYLVISQSNDISFECSNYVLPSLCYSAFPLCANAQRIHLYQQQYLNKKIPGDKLNKSFKNLRNQLTIHLQRICKGDCLILETELCSREYAIAKHHPIISKVLDLEECENLPDESEKDSSSCMKLGMDGTKVDKEDTCFWNSGTEYRGVHGTTITGKECTKWANQYQIPLNKHPELLGHSYCRNPGGIEMEPFCYIDQNTKESCGLAKCFHNLLIYIAAATGVFLVFLATATTIICYRRKTKTRTIQNINIPSADKNIYGNGGPSSPIELNTLLLPPGSSGRNQNNKNCFQNIPNYSYKEVHFVEELGEGAFGKVYKGELKAKTGKIFVAVKSLKEGASAKTQADFQREIELISELKHPNIICLLGIVVKQEPMCMLFEYMTEGDLHEFLIGNSPNNGKSLTQTQFLHIAIQIAQGMEYLSDNHYVHRDLAARNCLVTNDLVVKISDFGLSRDMYSCDYYRVQSKSLLPVRWMPPESILYGKFTTESDIWSYGVVLWEIYSYGLQPYYGYNNQEVINMIRARKLLPCPDCCPSYCYSLMVECWAELAIRRPSFGEISHRLRVWKQTAGSQTGAYFKSPDVVTNPQKLGNNSKSTASMESSPPSALCPVFENQNDPSLTWERNLKKATAARLSESQSSLTSRTSSLGNRNHGGGLNDPIRGSKKSIDRLSQKKYRPEGSLDRGSHRNVIVSTNGENIETKLT